MNKTINFLFGTVGTAGTMEVIQVFPSAPDEINSLIIIVVKSLVSILGGILTSKLLELMRKKGKNAISGKLNKTNVESIKND
ncbi:hypothetical protein [Marinilabilia sp.]